MHFYTEYKTLSRCKNLLRKIFFLYDYTYIYHYIYIKRESCIKILYRLDITNVMLYHNWNNHESAVFKNM